MSDKRQLTYYAVDEPAHEPTDAGNDVQPQESVPQPDRPTYSRRGRWGKWLLLGLFVTVSAALVEAALTVIERLQENLLMGSLWALGLGLVLLALIYFVVREVLSLRRLKKRWALQGDKPDPERQLQLLQHPDLANRWQQIKQPYWTEDEARERFEVDILSRVDQQASRIISRWSAEAAAMVAISPFALLDMLLVMWRNQRMMSRIAELYGVKLGYWSRIRLWRQVFANIVYAGLSEIATDLGAQWVGAELLARLSARAGQGLGAGLLTARLGHQVMALCRPVPYEHVKKPGYLKLQKNLLSQLKSVLPFIYKSHHSTSRTPDSDKVEK